MKKTRAYLDIETTGLSRYSTEITVIGIALEIESEVEIVQLYNSDLTDLKLCEALEGIDQIYTYNGSRFDLPFIKHSLGVDLRQAFSHRDLMYDCWQCNLKGGLKKVEKTLGIERYLKEVDGAMAVYFWYEYVNNFDMDALEKLLIYNIEDCINLKYLRDRLGVD